MLQQHLDDLWNFSKVCVLKFVVSEGEKIVIFYFTANDSSSVQEAAELGLISNLVSIVVRFIFQPLEEIAYNLFSKLKEGKAKVEDEWGDEEMGTYRYDVENNIKVVHNAPTLDVIILYQNLSLVLYRGAG